MVGKVKRVSYQSFLLISFLFIECLSFFFFLNWILIAFCKVSVDFCFQNFIHQKVEGTEFLIFSCRGSSPALCKEPKDYHGGESKDWRLRVVLFFLYHLSVRKKNFLEYVSRPQLADLQSLASCYIVANQIFSSQHGSAPLQISEIQKIKFVLSFCF